MRNFIILSSQAWGDRPGRPQLLAGALRAAGHAVHFIDPPQTGYMVESPGVDRYNGKMLARISMQYRKQEEGVDVYKAVVIFNRYEVGLLGAVSLFEELLPEEGDTVVIACSPGYLGIIERTDKRFTLIYDCTENLPEPFREDTPAALELDYLMSKRADLLLTAGSPLFLDRSLQRTRVYLLPNAAGEDLAGGSPHPPADLAAVPRPRVCFHGAVDERFDEVLFYHTVTTNRDVSFVLLGPVREGFPGIKAPNLFLLGPKPYGQLKDYLRHCDAGFLPLKEGASCNPVEAYEYPACGLPVISTPLPDLGHGESFFKPCGDAREFGEALRELLSGRFDATAMAAFVRENTWAERARQLMEVLESREGYGDYRRRLLASLRKDWENRQHRRPDQALQSLYALSCAQDDRETAFNLARSALKAGRNGFTRRTALLVHYLHDAVEEASGFLLSDENIPEVHRAELAASLKELNPLLRRIRLLYCLGRLDLVRGILDRHPGEEPAALFETANYYCETGACEKAAGLYEELSRTGWPYLRLSPLYHHNRSRLLAGAGRLYEAQRARFLRLDLVDRHLNRERRIEKWQALFDEHRPCDLCGEDDTRELLERPDGQKIVACNRCGLAYLEKFPSREKLARLYDTGYYGEDGIRGYQGDYRSIDQTPLWTSRLEWIEGTITAGAQRRLLDIGCSNGGFLEQAGSLGWETWGIEISPEGYEEALKKGIRVLNKELIHNRFEESFFDCVTLWDVIEHYLSPKRELQEIFRVLKPNGKLYISTPNHLKGLTAGRDWFGYNASYEHLFYFEPHTLTTMLRETGFLVDDCFSHEPEDLQMTRVKGIGHVLLVSARKPPG